MKLATLVVVAACGSSAKAVENQPEVVDKPLERVGTLRVDDGGRGDVPVIFIHGLAGDRNVWRETLAHVRKSRRAIAVDLGGFGESASPPTFSIAGHVADVEAVIKATAKRAILVGHSYGGAIASELAVAKGELVAGLVLVDTAADFTSVPAEPRAQMQKAFVDTPDQAFTMMLAGSAPGVTERVLATVKTTRPEAIKGTLAALFAHDPKPAIAAHKGPRLVLVGAATADFPITVHKLVPNVEHKVVAGTGHWIFLDKPDEFYTLLDAFLARL